MEITAYVLQITSFKAAAARPNALWLSRLVTGATGRDSSLDAETRRLLVRDGKSRVFSDLEVEKIKIGR
jgi:hypothetical protein